jgi:hypothetical protein
MTNPSVAIGRDPARVSSVGMRRHRALLALFALAGVVGILKGLSSGIVNGVDYYWMVDYRHGFIKRALVGTLFAPLRARAPFDLLRPVILAIHVFACLLIIYQCFRLFARAVAREESFDAALTIALGFLCLMCSPLMSSLAYLVGYVDVYFIAVALAGFSLVLDEHYAAAALVASVGPLIHESFVFLWSPVAVMLAWSWATTNRHRIGKLFVIVLPAASAVAVAALHNQSAAVHAIQQLQLPQDVKDRALYQLAFTLPALFDHMMKLEYPGRSLNLAIAGAYFLIPGAGVLWAAAFVHWRRWAPRPWTTLGIAVLATLAPLTLLALAWDLSRFLVWSSLSAGLVLIGLGSPALLERTSANA